MTPLRRLACISVALLGCSACSSRVAPITVTVLTKSCGSPNVPAPTDGVTNYQAVITAPDLSPITQTFAAGSAFSFAEIPSGADRVLTLTGYAGEAGTGVVKAWGQSLPFDVPDNANSPVSVTLVLRAAGYFAGVPTIADPTQCAKLSTPRAGHTATLLPDGRVLIAGGFQPFPGVSDLDGDGGASDPRNWSYLNTTEIFDPATDTSVPGPSMPSSTGFHGATLLTDGTVLVTGGQDGTGAGLQATSDFVDFKPDDKTWSGGSMVTTDYMAPDGGVLPNPRREFIPVARSRHAAVADSKGHMVLVGGVDYDSLGGAVLQPNAIWLDEATGIFTPIVHAITLADGGPGMGPFFTGRVNAATTQVLGGLAVAVVGGDTLDGQLADPPVIFFQHPDDAGYMLALPLGPSDANPPRTHAAAASLGTSGHLMVIAGGTTSDGSLATFTSVIDSTVAGTQLELQLTDTGRRRNDACAVTLADSSVLVAGGVNPLTGITSGQAERYVETHYDYVQNLPDGGGPYSDAGAQVSLSGVGNQAPFDGMVTDRYLHTCTVLQDGSVLITGGVQRDGTHFTVLDSIELYTPLPAP